MDLAPSSFGDYVDDGRDLPGTPRCGLLRRTLTTLPLIGLCGSVWLGSIRFCPSVCRWRQWVLQIVTLLSLQDGSVLDAVMLWKKNVDKVRRRARHESLRSVLYLISSSCQHVKSAQFRRVYWGCGFIS